MQIYRDFDFKSNSSYYKFLINYPDKITNYSVEPFNKLYSKVEEYSEDKAPTKGFWITANNPINSGTLLVPFALSRGIGYRSLLDLVGKEPEDLDSLIANQFLVINDIGDENPRHKWVFEKIVSTRFNAGLVTYFGSKLYLEKLNEVYSGTVMFKVISMCNFMIKLTEPSPFEKLAGSEKEDYSYLIKDI